MQLDIIIQARMGSARFPGKSLYPLGGRPSLGRLLDSLRRFNAAGDGNCSVQKICVATSDRSQDDPIAGFCRTENVECFRGDESNVASRFAELARRSQADYFVRLSGDSPLFDYRTLGEGCNVLAKRPDLATTTYVLPRKHPSGMNAEFVRLSTFLEAYPHFSKAEHFEHVTPYFYENAERFSIEAIPGGISDAENCKFSFDTDEDRRILEAIFAEIEAGGREHYEFTLAEKRDLYLRAVERVAAEGAGL